jgi:hypothetical protein
LERIERIIFIDSRIVPAVFPEDFHCERIRGPRIIGQSTHAVVKVGLQDDIVGLSFSVGEANGFFARGLDSLAQLGAKGWGISGSFP